MRTTRWTAARSAGASSGASGADGTGGGHGQTTLWKQPDVVVAAPGGIALLTPADTVMAAGDTATFTAQDINVLAGANSATAVRDGLSFYTLGLANDPAKPNQETGIALHAASGTVSLQSQSGATRITAHKAVEVSSTHGAVRISGLEHVLLAAGGAAIEINSAGITLKGPGRIEFKAGMKEFTGGASATTPGVEFAEAALRMPKRPLTVTMTNAYGDGPSSEPLHITAADGSTHSVSASSSSTVIEQFKPGRSKLRQPKRKN